MQNMIELTEENKDYWTPDNLAQALLGIWFAASHQPWMNLDFVVLELCSHPEYIPLLREEIGDFSDLTYDTLESFPILDSFIKETVRLNPLDTRAIRRKAMSPFRFTNGPSVPAGAMACVSSFDLMHEPESYPDPYIFNGQRFVSCTSEMRGTKFTDVSEKFPVWGYGSLACPGRFHASLVMKMVVAYLISNFDMRLENDRENVRWMWETFTMPYEKTRILMKERGV
ncbi:cytochrome P450 protein [Rutstroemia sp. NJR-2017a WRK4]|nr:cytochrome P450 protein [Rutstroemia sp. NJR-2017a WRK4]